MRERRRNPMRRVIYTKETIVFHRPGETPPDPIPPVTALECGHEVQGYTVGRYRACPECGTHDPMRKVVQVHSTRTHRQEDGKMLIDFHVLSRLECGHDVNGYGPLERACPECGREAPCAES